MKTLLTGTFIFLFYSTFFCQSISPSSIVAAGSSCTDGSVCLDFSLGTIAGARLSDGGISISQGFGAVSFESVLTNVDPGFKPSSTEVSLYPNPTADQIDVLVTSEALQWNNFVLFDASGRMISTRTIPSGLRKTSIDLMAYPDGIYYLRLHFEGLGFANYRILKN